MEALDQFILYVHIGFGTLSLILFWIPIIVKKGGKLHKRIGSLYVYSMWIVVITSFALSIINLLQGYKEVAAFLGFLGFITAIPLWFGITILKYKKEVPIKTLELKKYLEIIVFICSLGLIIWALILRLQGFGILMLIFGCIGLTSWKEAFKKIDPIQFKRNWLSEHLQGMMTTGIAAYTAFFAFGGGKFLNAYLQGPLMAVPWILPSIIGTIIIVRMKKKNGIPLSVFK